MIFTGFRSENSRRMAASDVYAMPAFEESCDVAFMQDLAMQERSSRYPTRGFPEIVEHGRISSLSERDDMACLSTEGRNARRRQEIALTDGPERPSPRRQDLTPVPMAADRLRLCCDILERGRRATPGSREGLRERLPVLSKSVATEESFGHHQPVADRLNGPRHPGPGR